MNYKNVAQTIESFIREQTEGFNGVVIGLSGGIDSTVVAYLAVNAIGNDKVHGLTMPYYQNQNHSDAIEIVETLDIKCDEIPIKEIYDSFNKTDIFSDKITKGNLMARIRMCLLYGVANADNLLVIGTSNKSELETGYITKFGDGGVDIEPIGDLYKTEVFELAKYLGVSQKFIDKAPTADLFPDQTDEKDFGLDYPTLDSILRGQTTDIDPLLVRKVNDFVSDSSHKRKMPPVAVIER